MKAERKAVAAALLAGCLLWAQTVPPSATIARDPTTGIVTAVVSSSKTLRAVCKYQPLPSSPAGPYTSLNVNCTANGQPSAAYYVQFSHPYAQGVQAVTLGLNANSNMSIAAIFIPVAVAPPGTATSHINYQIAANSVFQQGTF